MMFSKAFRFWAVTALITVVVSFAGTVAAQQGSGTIEGTVTGPAGGVLENVKITIQGENITTQTDPDGIYRLTRVPVGEHTVVYEYLGLQTATAVVTVTAGQTVVQNATLVYGGEIEVRGSPLLVGQAKALNRQKNAINISNIVAADQIGRFPDKNASEAAQRIPAVSLLRDQGEGRYVRDCRRLLR